ncbi:MAG: M17 family peptidase N-terminal domain-containing protein, partial [Candidatus Methylomirabilaceae bacterium]
MAEGSAPLRGIAKSLDTALRGAITRAIQQGAFRGKLSERYLLHPSGRLGVQYLLLTGLGKPSELTLDRARKVTAEALRHLRALKAKQVAIVCHEPSWEGLGTEPLAQAITEGALLGLYRFDTYKGKGNRSTNNEIESLTLLCSDRDAIGALRAGIGRGQVLARATNLARDLVNEPANVLT